MEELESSLFQTRKAHRIEQMVARWLRRSRDSSARAKVAAADGPPGIPTQTLIPVKHTVKIDKDALLQDYGFHISETLPLTVVAVTAGGSAHGKLFPGDQILQMNDEPAEDLSCERAVDILREAEDSLSITVVRCTSGVPKSSFLTEEKRARLKTNPVKVHFAEEVLVSGHSQGNSLLCMPNVLKVYLENGQTKAFKFEAHTTVKDIILTVKEKLSIRSMEYFALVLEEQYSISRLHLLHEEELIQQVVEREESHDYRCLFRVCFVPKDPLDLLKEDPVAFEYLYLQFLSSNLFQSCSDVLQERFAVEMKCSSALRLAALHIQERIYACAQPQKISLKYIEKDWGIENFISPTLLRNMKGKDIKKAISFHMKRNQNLLEPRQKQLISAAQLRLNYLQILGELKTYGGKIFNATLMLQDRESCIALLVGAKYGISQIINSKLNITSTLAEFASISRVELMEESEKVSVVKVYLQDIKVLTLLLESNSAKDLACLIAGYYRLFVDPVTSIFLWPGNKQQVHRVSAEEGYESRACSDSEESSEVDCVLEPLSDRRLLKLGPCRPLGEEEQPPEDSTTPEVARKGPSTCGTNSMTDSAESEASDSANTESRGCRTSGSSESMDALEEDDLDACSSGRSGFFHLGSPGFPESLDSDSQEDRSSMETSGLLCLLDLTQKANPQCQKAEFSESPAPGTFSWGPELSTVRLDPRLYEDSLTDYYSLRSSVSPASRLSDSSDSAASRQGGGVAAWDQRGGTEAQPSSTLEALALEDGSSDEEYYDAADKLTPPDTLSASLESVDDVCYYNREPYLALGAPSPTVSSLQDVQGEPGLLETKALGLLAPLRETQSKNPASRAMEMEPETMETKSVIDSRVSSISAIRLRIDPNHKENSGIAPLTTTVASVNETVAPRIGMEQCSCQLSYATCFRGLQPETEEEDRDLEAYPTVPLTSPPSPGSWLALPQRPARAHSCSTEPLSRNSHIWPEYCSRALRQLKAAPASNPEGFIQLMESLLELQDILEASWGNGNKHPPEKCTWHFSESRSRLCLGSQKLLSSCQHVIRMDQSPDEMQSAIRDTFQHLVQLAGLCFQFTDCSRCSTRHREAAGNLRDVVYTYHQFVEAAKLTCERGYHDLSVKLLARQCTALTAAVFCLTQKFRASTAL
ncbi:FERM and PDZ domain-containing protein 1 [Camelus dromedarius]|uniref:FERM and PDZ domain-containing protein 1 n=1 Tax=Camelus dromedarius TaxID=9838 RepID=A0A5N4E944_CAMDR|nr:FERM and PDZ domain-containing protein 1 [Camelus dromedarius]